MRFFFLFCLFPLTVHTAIFRRLWVGCEQEQNKSQTLLQQTTSGHLYSTVCHQCSDVVALESVDSREMSSDLDAGEVCMCVCVGEKQISVGRGLSIVQHGFCWQKWKERSRNSRELCRYGNNSKESARDAEMERDMCCLQRWTNIFVGQHTSRCFFL